jgi:hypothetical protein
MANGRLSGLSVVSLVVIVVSAALVLTRFGWYAALNSAIPFVIAVLWLAVLALSAWGAGDLVCRHWLESDEPLVERTLLQLLIGTAVLVGAAGMLGVAHVLNRFTLLLVLGASCCHGALLAYRQAPRQLPETFFTRHWAWLVLGTAGGVSLAAATTFAPFYDQWHYHLGFPFHWLRTGALVTFERQAYSFFPANMGLLYLYALAGPGAWAAQVMHWWMGALTAAGSASIARRLGAPVGGQVLAAALFVATPSVIHVGALAAADLGVAAFAVGAIIALLRLRSQPERGIRWAAMAGVFAGLAAGTKYLALASVVLPTAAVAVFVFFSRTPDDSPLLRRAARLALAFAIAATVVAGPWLLRNAVQAGNPVYPYFASFFGHHAGDRPETDDQVADGIGGFGLTRQTPAVALTLGTFNRRGHAGDIGPVHLLLMPLVLVWMWGRRQDRTALLVFGVLVFGVAIWALGPPLGRYLLPSLALVAALAGVVWSEIVDSFASPVRFALSLFLFVLLAANCNPVRAEYLGDQLACFLGFQSDEEYLQLNSTQLEAIRAANEALPADAAVLLVGEPRAFGIDREIVVEDSFRTPLLVELAEQSASHTEIGDHLRSLGVTHLLWNGAEAERIAAAEGRPEFLACSTTEARARLERFLSEEVTPVASGRTWEIGALARR